MLQKSNMENILGVFLKNTSREFSLKEISKEIKLAHTSVKRELNRLMKLKIVIKKNKRLGERNFPIYSINPNQEFFQLKRKFNEELLISSKLIDFLIKETLPGCIVLFGSYAFGEDNEGSDIDLFVESNFKDLKIEKYEKKLGKTINILFKEDINKLKKETINSIINGRILYGSINLK